MPILLGSKKKEVKILPLASLREGVVFPQTEVVLAFGRKRSVRAIETAFKTDRLIVFAAQKSADISEPTQKDLYQYGTLAHVERILHTDREINVLIRGLSRVKLDRIYDEDFLKVEISESPDKIEKSDEVIALVKHITSQLKRAVNSGKKIDFLVLMRLMSGISAAELANQTAGLLDLETEKLQELLEEISVKKRLKKIAGYLGHDLKVLEIEKNIVSKTQKKFDKNFKKTVLRERLKQIQKELGEGDEKKEIKELGDKIRKAKMTKIAEEKAFKELKRLSKMHSHNPEAGYIRTYLETLIELPWSKKSSNNVSLKHAQKILDKDHYGLKEIKERILEHLAVMKLTEKTSGKKSDKVLPTIICFVGPPGVGKTSLGRSIARALGREFVKVSLGGIRDEAEIRGHRRTYVGAMPGRIIQGVKSANTRNPIFMLDEIDKVGNDFRGDPSAALLEALDPEQNSEFSDHYLEVPFDLSEVMFITTANVLDTIPPALKDRLEVIRFAGYTELEKFQIAKKYLIKKCLTGAGLVKRQVNISDAALKKIINRYTKEAGVRNLEREIAKISRKLAFKKAKGKRGKQSVTLAKLKDFLGPAKYSDTVLEKKREPGLSTGLAWTQAGGEILFIEVALMPGKGNLILTGKLGDVMKESCKAALSYVRSRWQKLGLDKNFAKKMDFHIHVPEGAVPKDGPSAGIAITTALVSALTDKKVKSDLGMTGEITLRGRVLEIGGLKEKTIAAHRAGLKQIILPKDNKKNLVKVPDEVKKDLKFYFVDHMDQVLKLTFDK